MANQFIDMLEIDPIIKDKLISLDEKYKISYLKRSIIIDDIIIVNSFYLSSEEAFLYFLGKSTFDKKKSSFDLVKIGKFTSSYVSLNSFVKI